MEFEILFQKFEEAVQENEQTTVIDKQNFIMIDETLKDLVEIQETEETEEFSTYTTT